MLRLRNQPHRRHCFHRENPALPPTNPQAEYRSDDGGEISALDDVFETLAFEAEGLDTRNTMLQQYHDVYETDSAVRGAISSEAMLSWRSSEPYTDSLLAIACVPAKLYRDGKGLDIVAPTIHAKNGF